MVSSPAKMPPLLPRRLRDGLERIANVLRSDRWRALEKSPLNPTQAQILTFLLGRESKGARVNAIARTTEDARRGFERFAKRKLK